MTAKPPKSPGEPVPERPARPAKAPRQPRQERAKATVEAIVDAGFRVVAERGPVATTTQHIADRAGIGIGSFYEYFANKEAVFAVMSERMIADTVGIIRELTPDMVQMEVRDAIRLLLYRVGDMLLAHDGLYLKCAQHALRAEVSFDRGPVERALTELAMQYLMRHPQHLKARNMQVTLYIFIHGGIHAFIHHMNERKPSISYDQLIDGLANMVGHYAERELQMVEAGG